MIKILPSSPGFTIKMLSRTLLLISVLIALFGCQSRQSFPERITLGVVSFGESEKLEKNYGELKTYLEDELNSIVELEPTYNERQAISQINDNAWEIVVASPGLAAIAVSKGNYLPILPLEGGLNSRSVFIVRQDSPLKNLNQLNGKAVALGQPGSATGYYLALYNLHGLTLSEVRLASTPKQALEWLADGEIAAAAMSLEQYNTYRAQVSQNGFRMLFQDQHHVPNGAILVSEKLSQIEQEALYKALSNAPPMIPASAGYVANGPIPDYKDLMEIIKQVTPITPNLQKKPAPLY
ncbi:phosphate/phosphite/phosphonate ABC transporter substrate-binding protein [Crocosphaera sp. XPORK-15E]|uniref:phosphate/phosphite/phosphonate ABC transporter substrate-binding protein n=1 Tax=Crocosphaera sp. XPORK-15E TaxID=3110247 RepID=UPI002B20E729|nr:PhnD/SsuA/transferrin family substrate-binding protein [Crocosphaera sp. XPORK-15E]MEA5533617.1 PhnD/SsuA/transferrin family substrate-binding protein [Crocosphaera sp. XPORK-15E]